MKTQASLLGYTDWRMFNDVSEAPALFRPWRWREKVLFRNVTQYWPIQNYTKRSFRTPGLPWPKSGFWRLSKQNEMWLSSGHWQGQSQYKTIMVDNENCLTCTYIQTFRKQRILPSKIKRRTFRLPPVRPLFGCGVISVPWWYSLRNVGFYKSPDAAVCPRRLHWDLSPSKFQDKYP
jgi:hypothetical protein